MPMIQRPIAVGLHLCEQIIVDAKTRNATTVNNFSSLIIDGPLMENTFCVFAVLTDGIGQMRATVEIEELATGEIVCRREFRIRFDNPLQQGNCIARLRRIRFPGPGAYEVLLDVSGEVISSRRFIVVQREKNL